MDALNKDLLKWGAHVAIVAAYAASYEVARYFSSSHWMLPAGIRLACLLLVPRRFWLALAIGEMLPLAEMGLLTAHRFGALWVPFAALPPIALYMPCVAWLQQRTHLIRDDGQINVPMILVASVLCSAMNSIGNASVLASIVMPDGSSPVVDVPVLLVWFLGSYLGALTLTPVLLAFQAWAIRTKTDEIWKAIASSSLVRETALYAMPALLALMWLANTLTDGPQQIARMTMALPAAILATRHGWQGAAFGGLLGGISLASTGTTFIDPAMIQSQAVLAFVLSTSLLFGVRRARRLAMSASTFNADTRAARSDMR